MLNEKARLESSLTYVYMFSLDKSGVAVRMIYSISMSYVSAGGEDLRF